MKFLKNLRITALVKLINFEDATFKGDFDTYGGVKTLLHLPEKLVWNQYLEVFRTLVPPQIFVPLAISAKFDRL